MVFLVDNRNIDLYIDNKLVRSRKLSQIPLIEKDGILYIASENGFEGKLSNLEYFNWAVSAGDRSKLYRAGYSTKTAKINEPVLIGCPCKKPE